MASDGDAARALRWVVGLLNGAGVPFLAAGGLAARAHGARRELVDLDFYVPESRLESLRHAVGDGVVSGPARVRSALWDACVLTLRNGACTVELAGVESARYRDVRERRWKPAFVPLEGAERRVVLGVSVPVMGRSDLVAYKRALGREVDLLDLHDLTGSGGAVDARLAAYGSLMPGEINQHVLSGIRGAWSHGVVHGELHAAGWGLTHGYPALRWHPEGTAIPVRLFEAPDLAGRWPRLDDFEGDAYRRIVVPVTRAGDDTVLANIYALRP